MQDAYQYINISNIRQVDGFQYCAAGSETCPAQNVIMRNLAEDINGIDDQIMVDHDTGREHSHIGQQMEKSIKNSSG